MKALVIKCPDCGAHLKADVGLTECGYCGTSVMIDGGGVATTQGSPRPADPPTPQRPKAPRMILVASLVLLGVTLAGLFSSQNSNSSEQSPLGVDFARPRGATKALSSNKAEFSWKAQYPLLRDLDQDGTADVVGFVKGPDSDYRLARYSGLDGERSWLTDSVPGLDGGAQPRTYLGTSQVFGSGPAGDLTAYDLQDGGTLWSLRLAEVVDAIAQVDEQTLLVRLDDDSLVRIGSERGSLLPAEDSDGEQADWMPATGSLNSRQGIRLVRSVSLTEVPTPHRDAFEGIDWTFAAVGQDARQGIVIGDRESGTEVPTLVRYELVGDLTVGRSSIMDRPDSKELWRSPVPGVEPLKARLPHGFPHFFHAGESYCCAAYNRRDMRPGSPARIACFAMQDGQRQWDIEVPGGAILTSVSVQEDRVYVVTWEGLTVHRAQSGDVLWSLD